MANISQINGNLLNAATASLAVTASFALAVAGGGGGAAFPYTGSARITGSLGVTGSSAFIGDQTIAGGLIVSSGSGTPTSMFSTQLANGNKVFEITQASSGDGTLSVYKNGGTAVTSQIKANGTTYFSSGSVGLNTVIGHSTAFGSAVFSVVGGDNAGTANTSFHRLDGTYLLTVLNNGNIGIGPNNNSPSFNLDVSGSVIFRNTVTGPFVVTGSVTASALNLISSSFTQSRILLDNTFDNLHLNSLTPNVRDRSSLLRVYGTYTTGSANTTTNNHILAAHISPTFNPTNNSTSTFNTLTLEPQFLNTSATGSARGLLVTPAFAGDHPNFRSIEWDNSTNNGWGLYGFGNAPNYLAGKLSIGTLSTGSTLNVAGDATITTNLIVSGNIKVVGEIEGIQGQVTALAQGNFLFSGM